MELRLSCIDGGYHWFNYRYKISDNFGLGSVVIGGSLINISKDKEKDTLIEKMAYIDEVTQIFKRNRFIRITAYNVCYTKLLRNPGLGN